MSTKIDALKQELRHCGTPLRRQQIISIMRRFDDLGVGRFIPGRKGHPTRFEWSAYSLHVRSYATQTKAQGEARMA